MPAIALPNAHLGIQAYVASVLVDGGDPLAGGILRVSQETGGEGLLYLPVVPEVHPDGVEVPVDGVFDLPPEGVLPL